MILFVLFSSAYALQYKFSTKKVNSDQWNQKLYLIVKPFSTTLPQNSKIFFSNTKGKPKKIAPQRILDLFYEDDSQNMSAPARILTEVDSLWGVNFVLGNFTN